MMLMSSSVMNMITEAPSLDRMETPPVRVKLSPIPPAVDCSVMPSNIRVLILIASEKVIFNMPKLKSKVKASSLGGLTSGITSVA